MAAAAGAEDLKAAHLSKWTTAQHGKLPRHLAADGKFVDEVVGLVSVVDAESGDVAAVAPASRKEGLKGRCEGGRLAASGFGTTPKPRPSCSRSVPTGLRDMGGGAFER